MRCQPLARSGLFWLIITIPCAMAAMRACNYAPIARHPRLLSFSQAQQSRILPAGAVTGALSRHRNGQTGDFGLLRVGVDRRRTELPRDVDR